MKRMTLLASALMLLSISLSGEITDSKVYEIPKLPKIPKSGETYIDPVFGSTIMRVTDEADGKTNQNAYSYWPSFNKNSTFFHIRTDNLDATLYQFDPKSFKILKKEPLFVKNPNGGIPRWEDSIWSGVEANSLIGHESSKIWSYDAAKKSYTLIKDFSGVLPGENVGQFSKSIDDDVFSFTRLSASNQILGYCVWKKSTDKVLLKTDVAELDEVQVDKTGRYLVIKTGQQGKDKIEVRVADLTSNTITDLTDNGPDFAPGHSDNGKGFCIGADNWENRYTYRNLATPHKLSTILSFENDWSQGSHLSMLADDESYACLSMYTGNAFKSNGLFKQEIFLVSTDGKQKLKRLCHHRSDYSATKDYWDTPRACISRDGRFVVYSSNWENSSRRDVFIVKVDWPEKK